jgi:hypothetical protein
MWDSRIHITGQGVILMQQGFHPTPMHNATVHITHI